MKLPKGRATPTPEPYKPDHVLDLNPTKSPKGRAALIRKPCKPYAPQARSPRFYRPNSLIAPQRKGYNPDDLGEWILARRRDLPDPPGAETAAEGFRWAPRTYP